MKSIQKIAFLGGGGRTGNFVVRQLLEEGYSVKALVRDPAQLPFIHPAIEIIVGDALNKVLVYRLVSDTQAIISTIGQRPNQPLVSSEVTRNILESMSTHNVDRYLLVAGINLDTLTDRKGPETLAATNYMKDTYPEIQEDRQQVFKQLQQSQRHWTLVRVPCILFEPGSGNVIINLYDCPGKTILAGDIALFVIQQLNSEEYKHQAPFICN